MKKKDIIYSAIGVILAVIVIGLVFRGSNSKYEVITSKELGNDVGYQLCTESVNTLFIYCEDTNVGMDSYNKTQEELDDFLRSCNNWKIYDSTYCIGKRLEIRGK